MHLVFQGPSEKCCVGQDEGQSKGRQEVPQAQACEGHSQAQGGSILHTPLPQVRHVDVEMMYNFMRNRYKANVYLNGVRVNAMFDFSLQELKDRVRLRIAELDATSSVPLSKAVLWTTQPSVWDCEDTAVQIQGT